jgi:putative peptidoglycan lipid II flippase
MVNKILSFLNKEISGLHQAAYLLGVFALGSQIIALLRDRLLAFTFGASTNLDIYYAAFRIPDFLFVTIGSIVSLSIVIPFLLQEYVKGKESAKEFIDSVFTVFFIIIVGVASIVFLFVPELIRWIFPGFTGSALSTVILLTRILLLSPIILGVSNLFGALTQSRNRFFVYAISPILYNLGIILGIVVLYPIFGIVGLVCGVILGALMHLSIQIPTVKHLGLLPRFIFRPNISLVKQIILVSFPRTVTLSFSNIAIFFILSYASLMAAGSISVFNLAFNLQSVPLSIFGVSYSMAAFPALSRLFATGEKSKFREQFLISARHIMFWIVPASVMFIVLRAYIVRVILGSGQFNWNDTRLTAAVLALFSVSLVLQALTLLFVRGLYAMGSTGKPFYITLISGLVMVLSAHLFAYIFDNNLSFRFFMESLFKVEDLPGTSVTMLALGFTFGSALEGALVWYLFAKACKDITMPIFSSFFRIFSASVIMGFVTFVGLRFFNLFFTLNTTFAVFSQAVCASFFGIIAGLIVMWLMKSPEFSDIAKALHQKIWKARPVSPDSELV